MSTLRLGLCLASVLLASPAPAQVTLSGAQGVQIQTPAGKGLAQFGNDGTVTLPALGGTPGFVRADAQGLLSIDPTGPQGAQGPQGETGAAGARGDKGDKGEKGDTGNTGPQGAPGAPGPAGPRGDKGDAGNTGPVGATGATGATGPQGAQGAPGPAGPRGDRGDKGDEGNTGPQGPSGLSGLVVLRKYFPAPTLPGGHMIITLSCPAGKHAIAGGCEASNWDTRMLRCAPTFPEYPYLGAPEPVAHLGWLAIFAPPSSGSWGVDDRGTLYATCIDR